MQTCYRESKQSKDVLFSNLADVVHLHYLEKRGNTKIASFHLNALPLCQIFNHSLLDFFNVDDLQIIFTLL